MNDIDGNLAELDKDHALREDIRLLGRLLGDTLREQEGDTTFDLIEQIRQLAIRFRRDDDEQARRELAGVLDVLSPAASVAVIRAFTYFSQLANIAEDLDHNRRRRQHQLTGAPPQEGSLALALVRAGQAGHGAGAVAEFFRDALMSPVLTAHPTEVQRKSILDCQLHIARLLTERDRQELTPEELAANEEALRRADPDHVADAHPARAAADRARRDRERPVLLSLHLPAPAAAPVQRDRGSAVPQVSRCRDRRGTGAAAGRMDRRGPRRQPLRHPRRHAARAGPPIVDRAGLSASTRFTRWAASCRSPCAWWR